MTQIFLYKKMKERSLKISVIMSVYNGSRFLSESIESILNQSYRNFEFIIINDGSDDNSLEIIQSYMDIDSRIVLLNHKNIGLTKSLNIGVLKATGEYIARQDSDDISMADRFELFLDFVKINGAVDMYTTPALLIDKDGFAIKTIPNYFRRNGFHENMLNYYNSLIHGALIVRGNIIKKYNYNEEFQYSQDFELYHNLIGRGFNISYDDLNLSYKLRVHGEQISTLKKTPQFNFFRRTLVCRGIKFYKQTLLNRLLFRIIDIGLYLKVKLLPR
jgi:glycosyltransferase involved in cell wall biosynthesis